MRETVRSIAAVAALGGIAALALAFTEPTEAPTGSTVYAPVNTSGTAQTKSGNFTVNPGTIWGNSIVSNGMIRSNVNGAVYFCGGDDACLYDVNVANMVGIYGNQDSTKGAIRLGSAGADIYGSGGNVGIGTTAPGYKLTVVGDVNTTGCFRVNGTCIGGGGSGTVTSVATNNGLTGGTITTSGTLGLDLTSISSCTNSTTNKIYWNGSYLACGTDQTGGAGGLSGSGSTNYVSKWSGSTSLGNSLIYDNGTNVGIGTASPSEKLHVNGNIFIGGNWYKAGDISAVNNAISAWGAIGGVLSGFSGGMAIGMGQTSGGCPGIGITLGSTPHASFGRCNNEVTVGLYMNGPAQLRLFTEQSAGFAGSDIILYKSGSIDFRTQQQDRLFINSSGNVGIGTTNPTQKLEVAGVSKFGRFYVRDTQYGTGSGPGIGTDGSAVGVQGNYFNVGDYSGTAYAPVYASDYWINNAGRWAGSFSDLRLKKNIQPLMNALDKVLNVRGISFNWNDAYAALGHPNDKRQIGIIAQELETQFPELVTASSTDGYKTVNYDGLTAVLVEAVKEQQKEINFLKARLDALEKK